MKYIKEYSIFESTTNELYYADISTLNDYIHSICDNLDLLYIDSDNVILKIPDNYNGIFFINNTIHRFCFFFNKEYYVGNVTKINESIVWFKKQIDREVGIDRELIEEFVEEEKIFQNLSQSDFISTYLKLVEELPIRYKYIKVSAVEVYEKLKIVRNLVKNFDTFQAENSIAMREMFNEVIGIYGNNE